MYFFIFQLPSVLSQMNVPSSSVGSSAAVPTIPVIKDSTSNGVSASGPPAISVIDTDSDEDVTSLTIPFRSASIDDKWMTELEFRFEY